METIRNGIRVKRKKRGRPQQRKNMRNERERRNWTQNDVAELVGTFFGKKITGSHIGAIERGRNNPSIEIAGYLAILYEQSIEELLS